MKNPNCENNRCISPDGEIRVLPTGPTMDAEGTQAQPSSSNALLCRTCYHHEMLYRRQRNRELGNAQAFKLPAWESLKVYDQGE